MRSIIFLILLGLSTSHAGVVYPDPTTKEVQLSPACLGKLKDKMLPQYQCCTKDLKSSAPISHNQNWVCANDGVLFKIVGDGGLETKYSTAYQLEFTEGLPDGKFIEYSKNERIKRIEGQFKKGLPTGTWLIHDYDKKRFFKLIFDKESYLKTFEIHDEKTTKFNIKRREPIGKSTGIVIGSYSLGELGPYFGNSYVSDDKSFAYKLLYDDANKKNVIGVAATDYRFIGKNVLFGDEGDDSSWSVLEKKDDMCKSLRPNSIFFFPRNINIKPNYYSFWYECHSGFKDLLSEYRAGLTGLKQGVDLYTEPGEKKPN